MRAHLDRTGSALLLVLLLGIALLAGCGGGSSSNGVASKSPEQILAAAKTAAVDAASVHIAGSIINENKPISLDMELVARKGARGRIALEGLAIDVVDVEQAFYVNGSAAFYRHVAGPAAARLLRGRWLKVPASSGEFASLAQLTSLGDLLDSTLASHGKLALVGTTTVQGRQAVAVTDTSEGGTLYVAATGTPYPLEISKAGSSAGRISFDRWNQPVTLTAPTNAINITQLQNGR
ncbi:MAG TPA: hypothetical protein VKG82_08960 [Solirubrobacteraceae bacterium]|nr:hypothetical protein [Solirubrobacteraceae bacterium]